MYSVHYPCRSYDQILDVLSNTTTHSKKTSSLPLADFWHPARNLQLKQDMLRHMGIDALEDNAVDYCFEYPTPAFKDRKSGKTIIHSKSSMTDLMIILGDTGRITIEAKYTEYVKESVYTPLLGDWNNGSEHRKDIIQCWIDYIHDNGFGDIASADELIGSCPDLPYQFLHRTASACFMCESPVLVYQLFYDNEKDSIQKMHDFENLLQGCAAKLKLRRDRLPFYIVETEVLSYPKSWKGDTSGIFTEMKHLAQYRFGTDTVLDGYTLSGR